VTGRGVPKLHSPTPIGRGESPAISAERNARDNAVAPLEGKRFLTGRGVPHLYRLILTRGREPLAVRAERHAPDTCGVPLKGEDFLASRGVPTFTVSSIPAEASGWPPGLYHTLENMNEVVSGPDEGTVNVRYLRLRVRFTGPVAVSL
jgi:hypothetical protein